MPVITSSYPGAPAYQFGGHLQTIFPNVFRKVAPVAFRRERLELSDGDFLDLDFSFLHQNSKILIIGHGLEGSADRPYVRGLAHYFGKRGYGICAINFRSCSGELNRLRRMYHHGDYPDLADVIAYLSTKFSKATLSYVGFSMGGNIGLNLASRMPAFAAEHLRAVATFSSPLSLGDSIKALDNRLGKFYSDRFWKALGAKLMAKAEQHDIANLEVLQKVGDWDAFDRAFSLPLHDYPPEAIPEDFYSDVSPVDHLPDVQVPTLIVQAINDPMLGGRCYDTAFAKTNARITLEHPKEGGHVGFALAGTNETWAERRTFAFVEGLK